MTDAALRPLRPVVQTGPRPDDAVPLAGGWAWFTGVDLVRRDGPPIRLGPGDLTEAERLRLTAPRAPLPGVVPDRPALMGILNVTPDSFSDGGLFHDGDAARAQGRALVQAGADIVDIGGESTRPGSDPVPEAEERARILPVIAALHGAGIGPISVDTRKAAVAGPALDAGAAIVNDVSALGFDPALAPLVAARGVPVCLMHAQGDPKTMQDAPSYTDVTLDVFDWLAGRIALAAAAGIPRERIIVDPGIGFGKTVAHNLQLLRDIAVFHALGCPVLLGASRKRFIGVIGGGETPPDRVHGSVAVALHAVAQGVNILRVHDVAETRQALNLQMALISGAGKPRA
ncbi:dihydropteroate synthase [Meridianimarinicoccus sp. RP-17]|uniref:dihydropteroate synthase n=1 Tax=Meridianimarinicoccus zhengii TaxID=2056810 RepID=UPI001C9ADFD5|nr:dihydropteroate synthase [Phycocomes zhengii]